MAYPTKDELRDELRSRIHKMGAGKTVHVINELVKILKSNPNVQVVLSYKPVASWGEIDVTSLPQLLPSVNFEILENIKDAPFPDKKFDVIIIPLLGFNKNGYRLGHGGGWYDRFLTTQSQAVKIGVGYETTLIDFLPEPHDIQMDIIVTELGYLKPTTSDV